MDVEDNRQRPVLSSRRSWVDTRFVVPLLAQVLLDPAAGILEQVLVDRALALDRDHLGELVLGDGIPVVLHLDQRAGKDRQHQIDLRPSSGDRRLLSVALAW